MEEEKRIFTSSFEPGSCKRKSFQRSVTQAADTLLLSSPCVQKKHLGGFMLQIRYLTDLPCTQIAQNIGKFGRVTKTDD